MHYWVEFCSLLALVYQVILAAPNILALNRLRVLVELLRQLTRLADALQLKFILTYASIHETIHRLVSDRNGH